MNDEGILTLERHLRAPLQTVFDALTRAEQLVQWWGPEGSQVEACEIDLVVEGSWRITLRLPEGTLRPVGGRFTHIETDRLRYSWCWEGEATTTMVDIRLSATSPDETNLTLKQYQFNDAEVMSAHNRGWQSTLARLHTHLSDSESHNRAGVNL